MNLVKSVSMLGLMMCMCRAGSLAADAPPPLPSYDEIKEGVGEWSSQFANVNLEWKQIYHSRNASPSDSLFAFLARYEIREHGGYWYPDFPDGVVEGGGTMILQGSNLRAQETNSCMNSGDFNVLRHVRTGGIYRRSHESYGERYQQSAGTGKEETESRPGSCAQWEDLFSGKFLRPEFSVLRWEKSAGSEQWDTVVVGTTREYMDANNMTGGRNEMGLSPSMQYLPVWSTWIDLLGNSEGKTTYTYTRTADGLLPSRIYKGGNYWSFLYENTQDFQVTKIAVNQPISRAVFDLEWVYPSFNIDAQPVTTVRLLSVSEILGLIFCGLLIVLLYINRRRMTFNRNEPSIA